MTCSLALIAILVTQLTPMPVDSIVARHATPVAPRGGVLMVQLFTQEPSDNWPATLDVTFENGQTKTGVIGWIERNKDVGWATNPLLIRPIAPSDHTINIDPKDATTGPVLLVELPSNGHGIIRFGGDAIDPKWMDLPSSLPNLNITPIDTTQSLTTPIQDDMPQWSPLEYWRWTLIASRMNVMPPDPPNDSSVARLAALRGAQMWRIGFDRIARSSRGVAAACRDLLTNTTMDGTHSFACWIVQPERLHQLLSTLLDTNANSSQLTRRALRWVEDQLPSILWLEQVYGKHVTIALANPSLETAIATMRWQSKDDIPIAVEMPPKKTIRAQVERMPEIDLSIFGPTTTEGQMQWLLVSIGDDTTTLPIIPQHVIALPPSVQLQTLHPCWNLHTLQIGRPDLVAPAQRTTVQVRKLLGQWELFVQCGGSTKSTPLPGFVDEPADLQGIEAITILHPSTAEMLNISPLGDYQGVYPNDLQVFTSIDTHYWSARIVLPQAWIKNDQLSFSIIRTHGDSMRVETGPLPCVPWAINPSPIVIDLSTWDKVFRFPTHLPIK